MGAGRELHRSAGASSTVCHPMKSGERTLLGITGSHGGGQVDTVAFGVAMSWRAAAAPGEATLGGSNE